MKLKLCLDSGSGPPSPCTQWKIQGVCLISEIGVFNLKMRGLLWDGLLLWINNYIIDINIFIKHLSHYLSLSVCCGLVAGNVVSPMAGCTLVWCGVVNSKRVNAACAASWPEMHSRMRHREMGRGQHSLEHITFLAQPELDAARC